MAFLSIYNSVIPEYTRDFFSNSMMMMFDLFAKYGFSFTHYYLSSLFMAIGWCWIIKKNEPQQCVVIMNHNSKYSDKK